MFRDGDEVEIGSRNERHMTRYFPELVVAFRDRLPERCVVDGEIVVADTGHEGLDFWALQQRIHPAASRVRMLAERTPASFVAFDLLALGDDDLTRPAVPGAAHRAGAGAGRGRAPPVHLTPITQDVDVAQRWFELFEGAGLDGLIAKSGDVTYQPNKRVMAKVKHVRTADCVVAGYRVHRSTREAVGSLLLGLYDDGEEPGIPDEFRGGTRRADAGVGGRGGGVPHGRPPPAVRRAATPGHGLRAPPVALGGRSVHRTWRPGRGHPLERAPGHVVRARCGPSGWSRSATTTWRGSGSATPPSSCAGDPIASPATCGYEQLDRPVRYDLDAVLAGRVR